MAVQFNCPNVDSFGSNVVAWNWSFGDGATSTLQNPSHTYITAGTFAPSLIATNSLGSAVHGAGPSISAENPTVQFICKPEFGPIPLAVQFNCPGVDSSGSNIVTWNWSFGDGATSTLQNPSHTYTTAGTFVPALIATNYLGFAVSVSGPTIVASPSFATLYAFTAGNDGANPVAGLVLSGNNLYGTALYGGDAGNGTVFAVGTNGLNFTDLHGFSATDTNNFNSDGVNPAAGLVVSNGKIPWDGAVWRQFGRWHGVRRQ